MGLSKHARAKKKLGLLGVPLGVLTERFLSGSEGTGERRTRKGIRAATIILADWGTEIVARWYIHQAWLDIQIESDSTFSVWCLDCTNSNLTTKNLKIARFPNLDAAKGFALRLAKKVTLCGFEISE